MRYVFVPTRLQDSDPITRAAFCADEQGFFWEMHDLMFAEIRALGDRQFQSQARWLAIAEMLHLDMAAFDACLAAPETQQRVEAAIALFTALANTFDNVTGFPTLTLNGVPEWGSGAPPLETIRARLSELTAPGV